MGMQAYLNSINATLPAIDNTTLSRLVSFHILPGTAYFPLTTVRDDAVLTVTCMVCRLSYLHRQHAACYFSARVPGMHH
jgi:hypothetical protein